MKQYFKMWLDIDTDMISTSKYYMGDFFSAQLYLKNELYYHIGIYGILRDDDSLEFHLADGNEGIAHFVVIEDMTNLSEEEYFQKQCTWDYKFNFDLAIKVQQFLLERLKEMQSGKKIKSIFDDTYLKDEIEIEY